MEAAQRTAGRADQRAPAPCRNQPDLTMPVMHKSNCRRRKATTWLLALGLSTGAADAGAQSTSAASGSAAPQADQRVRQDMQATLSNLGSSGALGQHPDK